MLIERTSMDLDMKRDYDKWVCDSLMYMVDAMEYKTVHCYLPMGAEIDITNFIKELLVRGITVVTPKTLPKRKLENLVLNSLQEVEDGVFGTSHSASGKVYAGSYALIVVPGLAFDAENYRLGYGGGYYDTFISSQATSKTVGIFYPFQEVKQVPIESHDVQLDEILVKSFPQ